MLTTYDATVMLISLVQILFLTLSFADLFNFPRFLQVFTLVPFTESLQLCDSEGEKNTTKKWNIKKKRQEALYQRF